MPTLISTAPLTISNFPSSLLVNAIGTAAPPAAVRQCCTIASVVLREGGTTPPGTVSDPDPDNNGIPYCASNPNPTWSNQPQSIIEEVELRFIVTREGRFTPCWKNSLHAETWRI